MEYTFVTLRDGTDITHSEMKDGKVEAFVRSKDGRKKASCLVPEMKWKNDGFSDKEMDYLKDFVESTRHLIMEFSQTGGILGEP